MHPTPDEQLRAAQRLIAVVADDPALSSDSKSVLVDAGRILRRLERSWAGRLRFLMLDNQLASALLVGLAPLLPALEGEIVAAGEVTAIDESAAHDLNKTLQDLLARAVHLLPDDEPGDGGRSLIAQHLRGRLAADPVLNREPTPRPEEPTPWPSTSR